MVVGEISHPRDLVIVGGGPGGYSAAIRAAQLGLEVTLIEKGYIGGACLNEGCIPSKVWAYAAKKRSEITQMNAMGLQVEPSPVQWNQLHRYKERIVQQLQNGITGLLSQNRIEVIRGQATFTANNRIGVAAGHQFDTYTFQHAIIATGSEEQLPRGIKKYAGRVFLSHEAFQLNSVPEQLIVYGSDYIAMEIAMSYQELGSNVTILRDKNAFVFDHSIEKELRRQMKKRKINCMDEVILHDVHEIANGIAVVCSNRKQKEQVIQGTHFVVVGDKKPRVKELGLSRLGIEQTEGGFIIVDTAMRTSLSGIYAVGDVTIGPMLASKAIKQGKVAAERLAGKRTEVDLTHFPTIVHTLPPIASVGLTEEKAKEYGFSTRTSQFSLSGNGYALLTGNKDGLIKVISDADSDVILGIHMIGEYAVELSSTFVQLLEMAAKEEDAKFPLYPHPSMNEGILEAVEELVGQAIHILPRTNRKKPPVQEKKQAANFSGLLD